MDGTITRAEHEEFCRRIDEENRRQNRRIELLEENEKHMRTLTAAVERMASNMESMLKEQERQGKRLETLESRDGEMWRKAVSYAVTFAIGAVLAFLFSQVGM